MPHCHHASGAFNRPSVRVNNGVIVLVRAGLLRIGSARNQHQHDRSRHLPAPAHARSPGKKSRDAVSYFIYAFLAKSAQQGFCISRSKPIDKLQFRYALEFTRIVCDESSVMCQCNSGYQVIHGAQGLP